MAERRYNKDEIDAILSRAIERDNKRGELSHEDLLAAAGEVGISPDVLETAAAEVLAERSQRNELASLRREQWHGFVFHLIPYVVVNGLLITLNVLTTHFPWAIFPAFGWGIGLVLHLLTIILRANPQTLALRQQARDNALLLEQDVSSAVLQAVAHRVAEPAPVNALGSQPRVRAPADSAPAEASVDHSTAAGNKRENQES